MIPYLTLGAHAQRGLELTVVGSVCLSVCLSVCPSVKSHLTSGAFVLPENAVTYSAGSKPLRCRDPAFPPLYGQRTVRKDTQLGYRLFLGFKRLNSTLGLFMLPTDDVVS